MHPRYKRAEALSYEAIGAGIEVHRIMGPGLLETIYERRFPQAQIASHFLA